MKNVVLKSFNYKLSGICEGLGATHIYISGTLRYAGSALTQRAPLDCYRSSKHKGLEETALCVPSGVTIASRELL